MSKIIIKELDNNPMNTSQSQNMSN